MNRKKPTFSKPFSEAMILMQLLEEMAHADKFKGGYTQCLEEKPSTADMLLRHARAAVLVFQRIDEMENNLRPSDMD